MRAVYVILSKSATPLSKTIDRVTHDEYTHASFSFSETIQPMYSFGRKYTFLNFPAGLKEEPFDDGFYKFYHNTPVGVYRLMVTEKSYQKMRDFVDSLFEDDEKWRFNAWGLIACKHQKKTDRNHKMFCSQFVASVLETGGIDIHKDPSLCKPVDLLNVEGLECIYKGIISDLIGKDFKDAKAIE